MCATLASLYATALRDPARGADDTRARAALERYLAEHPTGAHAAEAQRLLRTL